MKKILFATNNQRKIREAMVACEKFDVEVEQVKLEIDEFQSNDPQKISKEKAEAAFLLVKKPVVVTDTFWNIPALNGFPGAYMKDVAEWLKPEDLRLFATPSCLVHFSSDFPGSSLVRRYTQH